VSKFAIFPDEKTAAAFVAKIDAAYGWPNVDAQTYAIPEQCKDGTYSVKIKDWLRLPCASPKWCKAVAIAECAKLAPAALVAVKPIALDAVEADVTK